MLSDGGARVGVDEQRRFLDLGEGLGPHLRVPLRVGPGDGRDVPAQRDGGHPAQRAAVGVDDVVEHQRVRPAVGDDVMQRLDEPVLGRGQRDHGPAHQRRAREVERPCALGGGDLRQPGRRVGRPGEVHDPPLELDVPADDLHDPAVGEPAEPGPQRRVPVDHRRHGGAQHLRVERPGQLGDLLDPVRVDGPVPERGVEVHALLQRQQRQHVLQRGHLPLQLRDVGGGERHEREVRRGVPGDRVVGGDRAEQPHPLVGERPDVGGVEDRGGPAEAGREHRTVGRVDGDGVDLQRPRQRHPGVAVLAEHPLVPGRRVVGRRPVRTRAGREPAEVVEQQRRRHRQLLVPTQEAQRAVTEPVPGHRAQLLLDRAHHLRERAVGDLQRHRVERGEPADRAGQVERVPGQQLRLAAVPLHLDEDPVVPAAGPHGEPERRDQRVVDATVDRRGHRAEQRTGQRARHRDGQRPLGRDGVGRGIERTVPEHRVRRGRGRAPEREVVVERARAGGLVEAQRPFPERRGRGLRVGARPGPAQVFGEDPQRHAVDHHVVDHEQHPALGVGPAVEPDDLEHPARARVEPGRRGDGLLPDPVGDGLVRVEADVRDRRRRRPGRDVDPRPAVGARPDPGAQHVVPGEQSRRQLGEPLGRQRGRGVQCDRLVEALRRTGGVEPLDDRRRRQLTDRRDGARLGARGVAGRERQRRGRAQLEHLARPDLQALPAGATDQPDRDDAVAAEGEEVVVGPDLGQPEDLRDDRAQRRLVWGPRRPAGLARRPLRLREGTAVDLPVGGQGERVQDRDGGRHHVLGQPVGAPAAQLVLGDRVEQQDVRGEVLRSRGVRAGGDDGLADGRVRRQRGLDLLRLQPHPADLDLVVDAAEELQRPVRVPAGEVAGAVEARARRVEGVGDEPGRGDARRVDVAAAEQEPGRVQLAADADRYGPQALVEHVDLGVRVGPADRGVRPLRTRPVDRVRDADRRLGRAVPVVHGRRQPGAEATEQLRRQRLASAPDVPQPVEAAPGRAAGHLQQRVEHRRDEVDERDALGGDQVEQVVRVAVAARVGDDDVPARHERQQDLVDGDVERQRGLEQRRVAGAEAQHRVDLPLQPVRDRRVPDHRALRRARRAGREHHVGEPLGLDPDVRPVRLPVGVAPGPEVDDGRRDEGVAVVGRGDHVDRARVREHLTATLLRPLGVDRHERPARCHDRQHRDHHLR
ncbi:hypothetical protein PSD17_03220 [Pseudonocardia sp. D17]|nr:hypothetical protein PSD17_03220 [Pseudonocardia sp. D17]